MCDNPPAKDCWDKALIISHYIIPVLIVLATLFINSKLKSVEEDLNWKNHDLSVLQEFDKTYPNKETRLLSLKLLNLIKKNDTQINIRTYAAWDLLRLIIEEPSMHKKYKFDADDPNCHYLAENLRHLKELNPKDDFLKNLEKNYHSLYNHFSSDYQLNLLLNWLSEQQNLH
ncbi:MAG: hypothetical protein WA666_07060 [Nitrospirota bacterium]